MIRKLLGLALMAIILLIPMTMNADQHRNEYNLLHSEMVVGDSVAYIMDVDTVHLPPALYSTAYVVLTIDAHGTPEANDSAWVLIESYAYAYDADSLDSRLKGLSQYKTLTATLADTTVYTAITEVGEAEIFVISTCVGGDGTSAQDSIYVQSGFIPIESETGF